MKTNSNNTYFVPVTATTLKETEKAYQLRVSYWTTERAPIKTANEKLCLSQRVQKNCNRY